MEFLSNSFLYYLLRRGYELDGIISCGRGILWIGGRRRSSECQENCHQGRLNERGDLVRFACEVSCGQEKMCLTVRGVSVPQRLHDRGKRRERG